MANELELPAPTYTFSIANDVVPLMKLARWSAEAGDFLDKLNQLRQSSPEFDHICTHRLGGCIQPSTQRTHELVARAIYTAECMLEMFTDVHGGDI